MMTGMVIKTLPVGEYDRHVTILTKERGKITAFAKGARRPNSRLVAATNPFSFGEFKLYVGKNSYTVLDASISNYFEELRNDFIAAYYGMYFLELTDYYTRENNDEVKMLKLLYQTMRALCLPSLSNELIRYIFEMKSLVINGEFPGIPQWEGLLESTAYSIQYIMDSSIEKLYTFTVNGQVLAQLKDISHFYMNRLIDRKLKSLQVLEEML
ncbi:MAG: DNA repair protein RecO [Lachnospiraceae bacterium]|nr:DNA repair protein RecO [Lachnospiraceae bacterium]